MKSFWIVCGIVAALGVASASCGPQKKFCVEVLSGNRCPEIGFDSGIHPDTGGSTGTLEDGPATFVDAGTGGTGGAAPDAGAGD
jgi:hypothetical protein